MSEYCINQLHGHTILALGNHLIFNFFKYYYLICKHLSTIFSWLFLESQGDVLKFAVVVRIVIVVSA